MRLKDTNIRMLQIKEPYAGTQKSPPKEEEYLKVVRGRKKKRKLGEIMQRGAIGELNEWKQPSNKATKRQMVSYLQ